MSFKKTFLLFIVFAFIGTYYYLIEIKKAEKNKEIEQEEKRVFSPIKKDEISEVIIEKKETKKITRLARENNIWKIKDPVEADADKENVDLWLDNIVKLTKERIVLNSAEDIAKFGLENPALSIKIVTQNGQTLTFQLGNENPAGNMLYGKLKKDGPIFLIASYNKTGIDKTVYQLRDKKIFHFENNDVQGIKVSSQKGNYSIEKKEKDWQLISPKKVPADPDKITSLLQKIKTTEIKKFIAEEEKDLIPYGLNDPDTIITLFVGKDKTPHILTLGKENKKGNRIYAKIASKKKVFLLETEFFEEFPYLLNDIRDKSILHFDKEQVSKIQFIYPDKTITTTRNGDNWEIIGPQKVKADSFEINNLLNVIENTKVKEFLPMDTIVLNNPTLTIRVTEKNVTGPKFISFGPENNKEDSVYVTTGSTDEIMLVGKEFFTKLSINELTLRYKNLLDIDEENIARIQIETEEKEYVLTKNKDRWSLNKPEKKRLDTLDVKNILWDLGNIKFKDIIDESGKVDLALLGLEKPVIKVTLLDNKEKTLESLFLSSKTKNNDLLYATTAKSNTVFAIEQKIKDDLLKDLKKLL